MKISTSELQRKHRQEYSEFISPSLKYDYYMRTRYFEDCGEKQYEGIFHESIDNSAEFFRVSREQIRRARKDLAYIGLIANVGFSYGKKIDKRVVVSYPRLKELVAEGKLPQERLDEVEAKRIEFKNGR